MERPLCLVTGGSGLVGRAISAEIDDSADFFFASSADADLRDYSSTRNLFERVKPTNVIHLAARVGGLFANMADNLGFFEDNIAINSNVVKCCHLQKIHSAVFCLSTCVFPAEADCPITEEALHKGPPHFSNEGYAYSKRMLECLVRYYREAYGYKNWICVIPTNIYGPCDNFSLSDGHVIPALIHKCAIAKELESDFIVSGSGRPLRQFIFVSDLAKVILQLLMFKDHQEHSYICCDSECEVSIGEIAKMISEAVSFKGSIVFDETKPDGIQRKSASNKRLKERLHDFKFTLLSVGIQKTTEWFLAHRDVART